MTKSKMYKYRMWSSYRLKNTIIKQEERLDRIKDRVSEELKKHMSPKDVHIQLHNIFDIEGEDDG